jgi:hypothetical protein
VQPGTVCGRQQQCAIALAVCSTQQFTAGSWLAAGSSVQQAVEFSMWAASSSGQQAAVCSSHQFSAHSSRQHAAVGSRQQGARHATVHRGQYHAVGSSAQKAAVFFLYISYTCPVCAK